jgi:hypothetical protein
MSRVVLQLYTPELFYPIDYYHTNKYYRLEIEYTTTITYYGYR